MCNNDEDKHYTAQEISKPCYLKHLSLGYMVDESKSVGGQLLISEQSKKNKKKLQALTIKFRQAKTVNSLNFECANSKDLKFKLYVNNRYLGSYSYNEDLLLGKQLRTLRIVELKANTEIIVNAWDRKNEYILLKDTANSVANIKTLTIKTSVNDISFKNPTQIRNTSENNRIDISKLDFINLGSKLIVRNKKNDGLIEQTACFYDDMSFFINYIKVSNDKKIEYEYYLSGWWTPVKHYGNKTKVKLQGKLSGRLNATDNFIAKNYEKTVLIDSLNIIRSTDFLSNIMIDLPNWTMVNLRNFHKDIIIDLPYATVNNFTHTKLYDCNECYLLYETVKDLLKAQYLFMQKGYRLKMFDCYRPYHIQRKLFEIFPVPGYVADPVGGSVHNKGSAVDLTIVDKEGNELDMGTNFDDLSRKSNHAYTNFPDTVLANRKLLLETMRACNFTPISMEWWHYNHKHARKYPKIDDAFPCKSK